MPHNLYYMIVTLQELKTITFRVSFHFFLYLKQIMKIIDLFLSYTFVTIKAITSIRTIKGQDKWNDTTS